MSFVIIVHLLSSLNNELWTHSRNKVQQPDKLDSIILYRVYIFYN